MSEKHKTKNEMSDLEIKNNKHYPSWLNFNKLSLFVKIQDNYFNKLVFNENYFEILNSKIKMSFAKIVPLYFFYI